MFTKEDKEFLSDPAYSMPLEKFYDSLYSEKQNYYRLKNGKNGTVTQAYPFSNEQLHNMFKHLKKKNPRVLTVGSSGDQLLYSLYYGSKDITLIDANLYSRYWIEYKMAAIKNLPLETFTEYFLNATSTTENNPFSREIYTKTFHDLSDESKTFWGQIFLNGHESSEIYHNILERRDASIDRVFSVFYKEAASYKKLQDILRSGDYKLTFINEEFSSFHSTVKGKFDIILLSNIKKYVGDVPFVININNLFKKHLNNNGMIQIHYDYHHVDKSKNNKTTLKLKNLFPDQKILGYGFGNYHYTYFIHKSARYEDTLEETEPSSC